MALDKSPGVGPLGIGEKLCRALAKIVMRAAGDQAKTACGKIQLCAGLEYSIDGETHAVGKWSMERVRERRNVEEESGGSDEEKESGGG